MRASGYAKSGWNEQYYMGTHAERSSNAPNITFPSHHSSSKVWISQSIKERRWFRSSSRRPFSSKSWSKIIADRCDFPATTADRTGNFDVTHTLKRVNQWSFRFQPKAEAPLQGLGLLFLSPPSSFLLVAEKCDCWEPLQEEPRQPREHLASILNKNWTGNHYRRSQNSPGCIWHQFWIKIE